jgi:phenylpropionate dioxygenase-like ring-hydroxylating dioxygenase large terminal subunit
MANAQTINFTRKPPDVDVGALIEHDRIHGSLYANESIFELEMKKIFYDGWVFVGHDSEVPTAGEYVRRTLGREEVLMVRQRDSSIAVIANRCAHRGNMMCIANHGKEKYFTCTYHGWVYDLAGNLKDVPYPGGFDKDKSELKLQPLRTEVYRGFVFATFNASVLPLADHLGHAKALIDRSCDMSPTGRIRLTAGWVKQRFDANWKMLPENDTDGYHLNYVHASFGAVIRSQIDEGALASEEDLVTTAIDWGKGHTELDFSPAYIDYLKWFKTTPDRYPKYIDRMKSAYGQEKADSSLRRGPPHAFVFPNLFLGEMNIAIFVPINAHECEQWHTPMLLEGVDDEINQRIIRHSEASMGSASFLFADDSVISERQQIALGERADWMDLSRGLNREHTGDDGVVVGHVTDESTNRAFWKHYKEVMTK